MIHHSPLPDVEIPDLALTEYVLAGGAGQSQNIIVAYAHVAVNSEERFFG